MRRRSTPGSTPTSPASPGVIAKLARPRRLRQLRVAGEVVRRAGQPLLWLVLALAILAPCLCFLVLAVSPRLFDQGRAWFTLANLRGAFTGLTATSMVNSIWVSLAAAGMGIAIGFPIAWRQKSISVVVPPIAAALVPHS